MGALRYNAAMDRDLLAHVLDVSRRLAETRSLQPLLNDVMAESLRLVGGERGFIVLQKRDGTLDFRVALDAAGAAVPNAADEVSQTVIRQVLKATSPVVIRNALDDPALQGAESVVALQLRSIMCVPLVARGNVLGAIYVENRSVAGRFRSQDLHPLILFANQVGVSIENAALNDQLEARVAERTRELREAIQQAEEAWVESVEANRLRTVLLSRISHDLRNPLTVIMSALAMLDGGEMGPLTEDQQHWVAQSLASSQRIKALADSLFELSQLRIGGVILELNRVSLARELRTAYAIARDLPWGTVGFVLDMPDTLPAMAVDSTRLRQVLLNMISFALNRTAQGTVTLHARVVPGSRMVEVGVADSGPTLVPGQISELFVRFGGTGSLHTERRNDLAIAKQLVELHGGQIWAETTGNGGLNVVFALKVIDELTDAGEASILPDGPQQQEGEDGDGE